MLIRGTIPKATQEELAWLIDALDAFAVTAEKDGEYWRATYTAEDAKGLRLLGQWMKEKGLECRFDGAGNFYGKVPGTWKDVVLVGSHRDTVKNGGKYDGAYGVLAALQAVASLKDEFGPPKKTVEVIAMAEEEASRFLSGYVGSRYVAGILSEEDLDETDADGVSLKEIFWKMGWDYTADKEGRDDLAHYVELHIEQGPLLETSQTDVGIVTGICGLLVGEVIFTGQQNHAGTTPMNIRLDPTMSAAVFMQEMISWARDKDGAAVCTFGDVKVLPGKENVVPGEIRVTFDIRSQEADILKEARHKMKELTEKAEDGISTEITYAWEDDPAIMEADGVAMLSELAERMGMTHVEMASGAGHDAQIIAMKCPANMIFVPSHLGISHAPQEYTSPKDLANGYQLLKAYLKQLAW